MEDNKRDVMFTMMMSPTERDLLKDISAEEGIKTMAGMVRHMIYTEARKFGLLPDRTTQPETETETFPGELVID